MAKPCKKAHLFWKRACAIVLCLLASTLLTTGMAGTPGPGSMGSRGPVEQAGISGNVIATSAFTDVPLTHWGHDYIQAVYQAGYVAGCSTSPLMYCPDQDLNRAEMAVFVVRGVHGADFEPPEPPVQIFADVPLGYWGAGWIHQLWNDGYTAGCGIDPVTDMPLYCPLQSNTRAEACVFFLRMRNGVDYEPPAATGIFADVPSGQWYENWVEAAYNADLIPPCQIYPELRFCPEDHVSRAMAAYMMSQAKGLIWSPDLSIWGIEVTQGIQNLVNDIPLVEGRWTYVRAYVFSGLLQRNLYAVPARLRAYRNSVELSGSPCRPDNEGRRATIRPGLRGRTELDSSFRFYLPEGWCSGETTFCVEINNDLSVPETRVDNNAACTTVTFYKPQTLYLGMVRLDLHEEGDLANPPRIYDIDEPGFYKLLWIIKRFHPIHTLKLYQSEIVEPKEGDPPWDLSQEADCKDMLGRIAEADIFGDDPVEYRMGMVHPDLTTYYGGLARCPGNVSWAKMVSGSGGYPDWVVLGGHTMAHELGHNKGLMHINCSGDEKGPDPNYPWPNPAPPPNCLLAPRDLYGYYGFDAYHRPLGFSSPAVISNDPQAARPHQAFPLMGYTRPRWISPYSYCLLLEAYGIDCTVADLLTTERARLERAAIQDPLALADPDALRALQEATRFIAAGGLVYVSDDTAEFKYVYQLDAPSPSALQQAARQLGYQRAFGQQADQPYTLVQADANGQVLHAQELTCATDGEGDVELFVELVPLATGTARVQIRRGETVLAERIASANPPAVRVIEPNGGEQLTPGATVRWAASDVDGDPLSFNVLYTPDDGQTWRVVRMGVTGDRFEVPSLDDLPGSEQGRMRVIANDGFYTVQDDSDGTFGVPGSPPLAMAFPPPGTFVEANSLVVLEGLATDVDDGPLSGGQLAWRSDLDGELGTGERLELEALSPGTHQITLTVTDSDGQVGSTTTVLYVGVRHLYLPIVTTH